MRVVVAIDGSEGSHTAARLVGTMAWPAGTTVHLTSAIDPGAWIPPGPGVPNRSGLMDVREITAYFHAQHASHAEDFERTGLRTEHVMATGRPVETIVAEADRLEADVVVVGSRGHGRLASLLVGSVSAGIVDMAECAVLIARGADLTGVVLAVDGSPAAEAATQVVATWPAFERPRVDAVAVAEAVRPWMVGISPPLQAQARDRFADEVDDAESEATSIAEAAAAALQRAGRDASAVVRRGAPAAEIIALVQERQADLVVVGTRGRTALARIVIGSVARDVVYASPTSTLIVRAPARATP
jgi:nucleotide-binding universal stress UspA family protein